MFIDVICLLLVLWSIFKGLRNGFIVGVFSFLAFIIGLAVALKLSAVTAEYLGANSTIGQRWIPFIAFAGVFLIVVFLVRLGAKAIEAVARMAMLGWLNKLGGILLYLLLYFFAFSIILFYVQQLHLIKEKALEDSFSYQYIKPLGPKFIGALSYILPFFKNMFTELEAFFEVASNKT